MVVDCMIQKCKEERIILFPYSSMVLSKEFLSFNLWMLKYSGVTEDSEQIKMFNYFSKTATYDFLCKYKTWKDIDLNSFNEVTKDYHSYYYYLPIENEISNDEAITILESVIDIKIERVCGGWRYLNFLTSKGAGRLTLISNVLIEGGLHLRVRLDSFNDEIVDFFDNKIYTAKGFRGDNSKIFKDRFDCVFINNKASMTMSKWEFVTHLIKAVKSGVFNEKDLYTSQLSGCYKEMIKTVKCSEHNPTCSFKFVP